MQRKCVNSALSHPVSRWPRANAVLLPNAALLVVGEPSFVERNHREPNFPPPSDAENVKGTRTPCKHRRVMRLTMQKAHTCTLSLSLKRPYTLE